jgi:hypothetical protein
MNSGYEGMGIIYCHIGIFTETSRLTVWVDEFDWVVWVVVIVTIVAVITLNAAIYKDGYEVLDAVMGIVKQFPSLSEKKSKNVLYNIIGIIFCGVSMHC